MAVAGIDVGAITTKVVLMNDGKVVATDIQQTGLDAAGAASQGLDNCCRKAGIARGDVKNIVVTGNGRKAIPFAQKDVTEIMAFAKGARFLVPTTRTAIDLGGQGIRVVLMNDAGMVMKFLTNDKCSTGTGCFLDVMAIALQTTIPEMGDLALGSRNHLNISNTCTVFAESEVVSLVARGKSKEDIIAGLVDAMAAKVKTLVNQIGLQKDVFFAGGVALNRGAVKSIETAICAPLRIPADPTTVAALGAALIAGGK